MNDKKITLKEFWDQYANSNLTFDKKEPLRVEMSAAFEAIGEDEDNVHSEGLVRVVARAYHDKTNVNGSTIEPDVFVENSKSLCLRPILANIVTAEDGSKDFGAHDFDLSVDENGNIVTDYQEKMIGTIAGYHFEYDVIDQVNRAVIEGYIPAQYHAEALGILNSRGSVDCSVEMCVRDLHYDAEKDQLFLDDYFINGLTLLGAAHSPGMKGSTMHIFENEEKKYPNATEDETPASKTEEEPQAEPVILDEPEEVAEVSDAVETAADVATGTELTEEQAEALGVETEDFEVSVLRRLSEFNGEYYSQIKYIVADHCEDQDTAVFVKDHKFYSVVLSAEEITEPSEIALMSSQNAKSILDLNSSLQNINQELKDKLAAYETAEQKAAKEALLNDSLYKQCWEHPDFVEIKNNLDAYTAEELAAKLALAFTSLKRSELNQEKKTVSSKRIDVTKQSLSQEEKKFGRLFVENLNKQKGE